MPMLRSALRTQPRRPKVNGVFRYISTLADFIAHKKSGRLNQDDDTAALVERIGEMSNFSVEELREFAGMM